MFERYTEKARRVVVAAQEEARAMRQMYIGTEHLLLGLIRSDGLACTVLVALGLSEDGLRAKVKATTGEGTGEVVTGQIPFTARTKKVLELALREALSLGHNYVGTEHLLLAIVRENEGVAAMMLRDYGVLPDEVRNDVIRRLSGPRKPQEAAEGVETVEARRDVHWRPIAAEVSVEGVYVNRRAGAIERPVIHRTVEAHEAVNLDFDADGNLIGVEVLASPRRGT